MGEAEIEFEVIRERKSLLDRDELFRNVKIKMMKQFKEQMMRLRIQLANKRKYVKINNSFFGEHCFSVSCSPNGEMCAAVGCNLALHIIDIRNGRSLHLQSLKEMRARYDDV